MENEKKYIIKEIKSITWRDRNAGKIVAEINPFEGLPLPDDREETEVDLSEKI